MSREKVKETLNSWNFDKIQDFSQETLIAFDLGSKGTNRQLVFSFCNDKLVSLSKRSNLRSKASSILSTSSMPSMVSLKDRGRHRGNQHRRKKYFGAVLAQWHRHHWYSHAAVTQ